jgi:hypothetical protein
LYCTINIGPDDVQANESHILTNGGVAIDRYWSQDARVLPCLPIWRGIFLDSCFFGAVWLVVLSIPVAARSHFRRRRGRCPECGYDLKADWKAGCSECGWNKASAPAAR